MAKDWKDWEEEEFDQLERVGKIKPRTPKHSSKGSKILGKFERDESDWAEIREQAWFAARVVEVHKRYAFVAPEEFIGEMNSRDVRLATIARKFLLAEKNERNFVVVGDRVLCSVVSEAETGVKSEVPQCIIQNVAPRKNKIQRKDPHDHRINHVLAANVDQLVVVASFLQPTVKWALIDRYLCLAEEQKLSSLIVLNKSDLLVAEQDADPDFVKNCEKHMEILRQIGYDVFVLQANASARCDEMTRLGNCLRGKISIFSGHSGVGKSSIINAFEPELLQVVEPNDDIFYKGRHTTSFASLLKLKKGGAVIDTPGIRSFLIDSSTHDIDILFREIAPFVGKCKFKKCKHVREPGCAVMQAVVDNKVSDERYQSYLGIFLGETGREGRESD